jgi:predicted ABC-type ATPase
MPRMIVVAGPPGSGKSSAFPVSTFGVAYFNADDRAAELNGGSYFGIPNTLRATVNREFEAFVLNSIARNESFAIETTLRSAITVCRRRSTQLAGNGAGLVITTETKSFQACAESPESLTNHGAHAAEKPRLPRHLAQ